MANILTINLNNVELDTPDFYFNLNKVFKEILNKCEHKQYRAVDIGYNGTCIIYIHKIGINLNIICSDYLKCFLENNEYFNKIKNKIIKTNENT